MLSNPRSRAVLASLMLVITVLSLSWFWREPLKRLPDQFKQSAGRIKAEAQEHGFIPGLSEAQLDQLGEGVDGQKQDHHDISNLLTPEQQEASDENMMIEHNVLRSKMTENGDWWRVDFLDQGAYNPSMIPHPTKNDTWVAIGQRDKAHDSSDIWNVELVCEVTFANGENMTCTHSPMNLPIAATVSEKCTGDMNYINRWMGPHDARLFHGPTKPYVMYVSQHENTCLGQWMQDFRRVFDWSSTAVTNRKQPYFWPTQLQRPAPFGKQEKNWFIFWDSEDKMYVHYDIVPKRGFARLNKDGTVGENLASYAEEGDAKCLADHLVRLKDTGLEWIHQATNSIAVTLCKQSDPECRKTDDNTFNMIIFQKKTFYYHGVYSPFVMLLNRKPPFQIHGISSKPFWYSGRGVPMGHWTDREGDKGKPINQSEMVFTTSLNWKRQGAAHHGYLDDEIIINFGIEDRKAGGIDVTAEDLMMDMALCDGTVIAPS